MKHLSEDQGAEGEFGSANIIGSQIENISHSTLVQGCGNCALGHDQNIRLVPTAPVVAASQVKTNVLGFLTKVEAFLRRYILGAFLIGNSIKYST